MPVVLLVTLVLDGWVWQIGLILTAGILWIIFGALLLLNTLKASGALSDIRSGFADISPGGCR